MYSTVRTCSCNIKDIYDLSNQTQLSSFKSRFGSVIDKFAGKSSLGTKDVISIETNYLYVVTSALHGDEPNYNGDFFRWSELLKKKSDGSFTFETWIGRPVLENHNMSLKRGMIIDAFPIKGEKSIDMLHRVDERINPNLAKGLRNGSIKGTSMGVMVGHSYCSVCNNLAYDETQWCNHLSPTKLNIKGKRYTGQDGNLYPDKIGTICYEDNRDLFGVEDSFITLGEPADPKALTKSVLA